MEKKPDVWKPTCERYVAFLDIMGFRDMVYRESHEDVKKMLTSFYPAVQVIEQIAKNKLTRNIEKTTTRPVIFSDSIILVSSDDSEEAATDILSNIGWITINAIAMGIPIKGAIAYGEQTADFKKSLHFGRPLIDAYELQKELQLYCAVVHHTMEKRLAELNIIKKHEDKGIFKYPVPMKSGKIIHYVVNWGLSYIQIIEELSQLYLSVSGKPRIYVDNTMEFVNWLIKKKEELKQ